MIKTYFLILLALSSPAFAAGQPCEFDRINLKFTGTNTEQTICLTRFVKKQGNISAPVEILIEPLNSIVGREVKISQTSLKKFIQSKGISERDIGGSIDSPLSKAKAGSAKEQASYFVIHDTSTPNYLKEDFPSDINNATWKFNNLSRWMQGDKSKAHIFINRLGESVSPVEISIPWRATKFELGYGNTDVKGLFIHVELVQPRRSDLSTKGANDAIAPTPGYTAEQYQKLALVYTVASVRKGYWLIPAFHAVLDADKKSGHDDPQNFDLNIFAEELSKLINELN